ncbi:hypothetical protein F5X96DRAFT_680279 [Biscogniauxia mediterranea]|nr:hypothetical protein F5X96DRAFT_680279 [Biscogniauxia mediterranea]
MCKTAHFRSRACGHHWLQIAQPCGPGRGFGTCATFGDGVAREPAAECSVGAPCPACSTSTSMGGMMSPTYDHNNLRMVTDIRRRWRWGLGPRYIFLIKILNPSPPPSQVSGGIRRSKKMLPTPDTSHVAYERVYEPAEDSFLLLDTLSSPSETAFLQRRFDASSGSPAPLVVEIGPGSGVVIGFVHAHAGALFGRSDVLTGAVDVSAHACAATNETVRRAEAEAGAALRSSSHHQHHQCYYLGAVQGDLVSPLAGGAVDVLIFNPPYVPTPELPSPEAVPRLGAPTSFDDDSLLLALTYAGGRDGMETTDRLLGSLPRVLSRRGCAYVLLCAQNRPEEVKERIRGLGDAWRVETVGTSGKKAGWEKLQIIRIWRDED